MYVKAGAKRYSENLFKVRKKLASDQAKLT